MKEGKWWPTASKMNKNWIKKDEDLRPIQGIIVGVILSLAIYAILVWALL